MGTVRRGPVSPTARRTIGVLSPVVGGFYFGALIAGVARAARAAGHRVVAVQTYPAGLDRERYPDESILDAPVAPRRRRRARRGRQGAAQRPPRLRAAVGAAPRARERGAAVRRRRRRAARQPRRGARGRRAPARARAHGDRLRRLPDAAGHARAVRRLPRDARRPRHRAPGRLDLRVVRQPRAGRRGRRRPDARGRLADHGGDRGDGPQRHRLPACAAGRRPRAPAGPGGDRVRPRRLRRARDAAAVDRRRALRPRRRDRRVAAAVPDARRGRARRRVPRPVDARPARVLRVHRVRPVGTGCRVGRGQPQRLPGPAGPRGDGVRRPDGRGRGASHRRRAARDVVARRRRADRDGGGARDGPEHRHPGPARRRHVRDAAAPRSARTAGHLPARRGGRRGGSALAPGARDGGPARRHRGAPRADQGLHPRDARPQRAARAHHRRPVRGRHGPPARRRREPSCPGLAAARRPRATPASGCGSGPTGGRGTARWRSSACTTRPAPCRASSACGRPPASSRRRP